MLPKKRDSVIEDQILLAPSQTTGANLDVPQLNLSRSASPLLEAMSARISDNASPNYKSADPVDDPQLLPMSARVA